MNNQELKHQAERVATYKRLCEIEAEVLTALRAIESTSDGPFTGSTSKVQPVLGFTIRFPGDIEVDVAFPTLRGLKGYVISQALRPVLNEILDRIWEEKEKL
jgi:hypothetical protein